MHLQTGPNDHNRRLDRILRKALPDYPLSLIHRLLRQGSVLVNGRAAAPQDQIPSGAIITLPEPALRPIARAPRSPIPDSPSPALEILWQDSDLLILNKPAGIAVHGPASLDSMVQRHLAGFLSQRGNASLSFKPGPLHRLDRPTSGVIVFSASLEGARSFSVLMREGKIQKQYLAIVEGRLDKAEMWDNLLIRDNHMKKTAVAHNAAKHTVSAMTSVTPLCASIAPYKNKYTLILARIHTGRTHQIRAQAAAHGCPLAGDVKYGGHTMPGAAGFFLHAWKLTIDGKIEVCAPLPAAFQSALKEVCGLDAETETLEQLVLSSVQ
jgi:23S rRNA pseudouridine955/2504/2580 synthase